MAITSSAKKALRVSFKKRVFNLRRRKNVEDSVKEVEQLITLKKIKEATELIPKAYKAIDKAAKGNTIKKGKADRMKARLMARLNK